MKNKKRETEPVQEPTSVSPLLAKGGGRACGETIFFDGTSYTPHYAAGGQGFAYAVLRVG